MIGNLTGNHNHNRNPIHVQERKMKFDLPYHLYRFEGFRKISLVPFDLLLKKDTDDENNIKRFSEKGS